MANSVAFYPQPPVWRRGVLIGRGLRAAPAAGTVHLPPPQKDAALTLRGQSQPWPLPFDPVGSKTLAPHACIVNITGTNDTSEMWDGREVRVAPIGLGGVVENDRGVVLTIGVVLMMLITVVPAHLLLVVETIVSVPWKCSSSSSPSPRCGTAVDRPILRRALVWILRADWDCP